MRRVRRYALVFVVIITMILTAIPAFAFAEGTDTRLTDFITSMMSGENNDVLYTQFDSVMRSSISRADFDQIWPQLLTLGGDFKAYYGATEVSEVSGYTVLTQALDMSSQDLLCTMSFNADGTIAGLFFSIYELPASVDATPTPTSAPPEKVRSERITIGTYPWKLPGTLLMPETNEPVPAVVLVQGSGATDRDESIQALKPFKDIAEALSKQGIAVLRYDKRTYAQRSRVLSLPNYNEFTVEEEIIQDAITAGRLLAADSRVDPNRIFIMGHSLGAMLAPRIVYESNGLFCGMILAAGTNKSFLDVLLRQAIDADYLTGSQQNELIQDGTAIYTMSAEEAKKAQFNTMYAYYYWEMLQYPTAVEYLERLALPTLIINGSRDIQVIEDEGRVLWEQVLDMDAPWLTCYWTDVNHMLMRPDINDPRRGTLDEYKIKCTVAEDITDQMATFILTTEE